VSTTIGGNPKTLASAIEYEPYGGIKALTYGNSISLTVGYDNQYRISSLVAGSVINLDYGYDPNGNIISIVDSVNPPSGQGAETHAEYSYQQGTNKLAPVNGTSTRDYEYDDNGNITSENNYTYVYDLSNRIIRVLDGANQIAEYTFNGVGQRIKKVTQGGTRIFHYDHKGHLIAETNQNGQMIAEFIYIGDRLLSMVKPGEVSYYFHNDHLGTPWVVTNEAQAVSWKAVYEPFGKTVLTVENVENPFRFPGQYYDTETGLHYNYHRYYDPTTGRFLTPDPIGLTGGINLFAYPNNPVNLIDPLGLSGISVFLGTASYGLNTIALIPTPFSPAVKVTGVIFAGLSIVNAIVENQRNQISNTAMWLTIAQEFSNAAAVYLPTRTLSKEAINVFVTTFPRGTGIASLAYDFGTTIQPQKSKCVTK
jgi:RHS repeat-associated protein